MPKIAFFLCAFLLAGTAYAVDEGYVMEMKNGVVHTIQTAFKSLKEKVDYYRQALDNLNNQADGLKRSTHEQIADIERRAQPQINSLLQHATGSNLKECTDIANSLGSIASETFDKAAECLTNEVNRSTRDLENILNVASKTLHNLEVAENSTENCVRDTTVWEAVKCITAVGGRVTYLTVTKVPSLLASIGDLAIQGEALVVDMATCSKTQGTEKVQQSALNIIDDVTKCVEASNTGYSGNYI